MGAFHPLNYLYVAILWIVISCAGYYVGIYVGTLIGG